MKKFFSIILVAALLAGMLLMSANAAGTPAFQVSEAEADPGDTVELTVSTVNNPGIASFELIVNYDKAVLDWTGVTKGALAGNWDVGVGETALWVNTDNYTEDGVVLTLTFQVKDTAPAGLSVVSVSYEDGNVFDENAEDVQFETKSGGVTVKGTDDSPTPAPPPPITPTPTATATADPAPITPTPTATATADPAPITPTPTATATADPAPITPTPTATATADPAPITPTPTATATATPVPITLDTPKITKLENAVGGVKITWGEVDGAEMYRVFRKNGNSWKKLIDTADNSYTWTGAVSGTAYTFTVRCVTEDGAKAASAYDKTGKTITYIAAPVITSFGKTDGGITIGWGAVKGAERYRVFCKTGGSAWKAVGTTSGTQTSVTVKTYDGKNAFKSNTNYTFTVRCLTKNGTSYTSAYDTTGKTTKYLNTPVISKLENVNGGVKVAWGKVTGAAQYRVFVKVGTKWVTVGDTTATNMTVTKVSGKALASNTNYTFTVRCLSKDAKSYQSGYKAAGASVKYIAAPVISKLENVSGGVKITWGKVTGAAKYRVFAKVNGKWVTVGDTTGTTLTVTKISGKALANKTSYTFTVRCLSSDGKSYTSGYNATGKTFQYLLTGWQQSGGKWYYYQSGELLKNSWAKDGSAWAWVGSDGAAVTSQWVKIDGTWYWFDADGHTT